MKATTYLNNLAATLKAAREADALNLTSAISGINDCVLIGLTTKQMGEQSIEFKKELVVWFLEGKLTTYHRTSVPFGERKNSRKKQTTQYFIAERDNLKVQLGHSTIKNYQPCFWETGGEALVKSALCKEGEFSYYNQSFVSHALEFGAKFEDLGEKK